MAMNKKEQDEFNYARSFRAMRFTDHPRIPDVPVPSGSDVSVGYAVNISRALNGSVSCTPLNGVFQVWSKRSIHGLGDGSVESQRHASRDGIAIHSSRIRALGALRRELEDRFAKILLEIDDAIAEEESGQKREE